MKNTGILCLGLISLTLVFCGCEPPPPADAELSLSLRPLPGRILKTAAGLVFDSPAILEDPDHFVWGGSVVRGDDGRYYMFYSLFDSGPDNPPFQDAWLLSSKIACAVSDVPDRGFAFLKVILRGAGSENRPEAWDAQGVHNPHIKKFGNSYYLYYIGSRDPGPRPAGSPGEGLSVRDRIQQVQKMGVIAVKRLEDLIAGNFERPDRPLLSPRTRVKADRVIDPSPPETSAKPDNLIVVNPSVAFRPSDGKYLLFFKGNLYDPTWRGVHGLALGDRPTGPFRALDEFVFDVRMPDGRLASAEDPCVWYHRKSGRFYAVIKDFSGRITGSDPGLALMSSSDGLMWAPARNPVFSRLELRFEDGTILPVSNLERPQLLLDEQGVPLVFYAACSVTPVGGKTDGSTFNVQLSVRVEESPRE